MRPAFQSPFIDSLVLLPTRHRDLNSAALPKPVISSVLSSQPVSRVLLSTFAMAFDSIKVRYSRQLRLHFPVTIEALGLPHWHRIRYLNAHEGLHTCADSASQAA